MPAHAAMKLGKRPARIDARTLRLDRFLTPHLPAPPPAVDWSHGIKSWGMMANNRLGCCTIAALGHAVQVWSANTIAEITVPDDTIVHYYSEWDGYVLGDPSSDLGGIEVDVLNRWRKSDFDGHKLIAYADAVGDHHTKQAIALFGGVYIGLRLPLSAQDQEVWDAVEGPTGEPNSWGGHAVFVLAYDPEGLTCVTWGELKKMTWDFWFKYCDECHALFSEDWLAQFGGDPAIDRAALQNALIAVTG